MLTAIIRERYQKKNLLSVKIWIYSLGWGLGEPDGENDGTENKGADNVKSLFNKHSWDAAEAETWKLPFYS